MSIGISRSSGSWGLAAATLLIWSAQEETRAALTDVLLLSDAKRVKECDPGPKSCGRRRPRTSPHEAWIGRPKRWWGAGTSTGKNLESLRGKALPFDPSRDAPDWCARWAASGRRGGDRRPARRIEEAIRGEATVLSWGSDSPEEAPHLLFPPRLRAGGPSREGRPLRLPDPRG